VPLLPITFQSAAGKVDRHEMAALRRTRKWHGPPAPEVAHRKARTAALTKQPTKIWKERVKERPAFLNFHTRLAIWGGVQSCIRTNVSGRLGCRACTRRTMRKLLSPE
jgi:uncharacterized protein GlcG (DUF336 family)